MVTFVIRLLFWLVFVSSGAGTAWAQLNAPSKSAVVSTPQVRAELVAHAPDGVQTGKTFWLGLQLQHTREWHTYWRNPGDSGLPTLLEFKLPPGLEVGPVLWPLPQKLSAGTLTNYGFENDALLAVAVKVTSAYRAPMNGQLPVQLHANWLVCRLECIPQEGDFALELPTKSSFAPHAKAFASLIEHQPSQLAASQKAARFEGDFLVAAVEGLPANWVGQKLSIFPTEPELLESSTDQHALAEQSWQGSTWSVRLPVSTARNDSPTKMGWLLVSQATGESRKGVELVLPVSGAWPSPTAKAYAVTMDHKVSSSEPPSPTGSGAFGFLLALAGALLGGLILNAMPCVLPILAIKVLGFAQHGASKHMRRLTGVAYTVGVVASFLALGGAVLLLRSMGEQLGLGISVANPRRCCRLAVLFTLIALNLWDVYQLRQCAARKSCIFAIAPPRGRRVAIRRARSSRGVALYRAVYGRVFGRGDDNACLAGFSNICFHGPRAGLALFIGKLGACGSARSAQAGNVDGHPAPCTGVSHACDRHLVALGLWPPNQRDAGHALVSWLTGGGADGLGESL
jgi:DsbC/DsbD-like thiol-disulfide interchange protein